MPFPTTGNELAFPFLTIVLFLPAVGALICSLTTIDWQIRATAGATVVLEFLLSVLLLIIYKSQTASAPGSWQVQFADSHDWISTLGISYLIGVDGVSVFLVPLTALIMGIAVLAATYMINGRVGQFMPLVLLTETAIMGVFLAENLFLFFVFWEAMLIPMYFLVGIWGEERRVYATTKFVVYTVFGSFFMLVAIFYLWSQSNPHTLDMVGSNGLIAQLGAHPLSATQQAWLFLAFGIAFAIKLPIWPFHTWAPTAYTESPIPVVIILSGILSKAGAFGLIRYSLTLFPRASHDLAGLVSILAIIGMLYAAGMALVQTDIKRIVAYASISHVNLIALGIFALNTTGLDGSVLQIVNHAVIITGLFLAVAYVSARTGTRLLPNMGGLGTSLPWLMWLFFVFILAGLDLPGLSSFAGEFLILAGVFKTNAWFSGIAALTVIMAAWYMIRFFQDTMNGPVTASSQAVAATPERISDETVAELTSYQFPVLRRVAGDLSWREGLLLVPLIALVIYLGIQPNTMMTRMNGTTTQVTTLLNQAPAVNPVGGGR